MITYTPLITKGRLGSMRRAREALEWSRKNMGIEASEPYTCLQDPWAILIDFAGEDDAVAFRLFWAG